MCETDTNNNAIISTTTTSGTDKNKLTNIINDSDATGSHSNPDMQAFSLRDDQQFILLSQNNTDKHNPQDFDQNKSKMFMSRGDTVSHVIPPTFPTLTVGHTTEDYSIETFEKDFL